MLACRTMQEMRGRERYACGFCNGLRDANSQISIVGSAPRLLMVHLKRFSYSQARGSSKNNKNIKFGPQLVLPVSPNRPEEPDAVR
jgi:ubiquitin C-terminal hydrolase